MKKRVLILCTGNSCRSQMAEGLLRARAGERFEVFSAGLLPSYVHPRAIKAMAEVGIDIRGQTSKSLGKFLDQPFDYVITVCDRAAAHCPGFPGRAERLHWPIDDPVGVVGDEEAVDAAFARARDVLAARIDGFLAEME